MKQGTIPTSFDQSQEQTERMTSIRQLQKLHQQFPTRQSAMARARLNHRRERKLLLCLQPIHEEHQRSPCRISNERRNRMPQGKRGGEKEYVVENKNNRSSFLLSNNSQNLIDETKITFFLVNGDFFLFFKLFFIFFVF